MNWNYPDGCDMSHFDEIEDEDHELLIECKCGHEQTVTMRMQIDEDAVPIEEGDSEIGYEEPDLNEVKCERCGRVGQWAQWQVND